MAMISDNLRSQRAKLIRILRNTLLALGVVLLVDRGLDALLRQGMDRYFGLNTPGALLMVGHSHVVLGLDKPRLERALDVPVAKYARAGARLADRILMVHHYSERQPDGPRLIVFGVDGHLFAPRGLSSNAHALFYPHMNDPVVGQYLRDHSLGPAEYWPRRLIHLARYNDALLNSARRGLQGNWANSVRGQFDPAILARQAELGDFRRIGFDPDQIALFETFLDTASAQGWQVVLTFVPTTDVWNDLEPEKFARLQTMLQDYAAQYDGVQYLDLRPGYDSQYDLFVDPIHLNARGQRQVTDDLAAYLRPLLTE